MKRTLKPLLLFLLIALCMTGCGKEKMEVYEENPPVLPEIVAEYYDSIDITDEVRSNAKAVYVTCDFEEPIQLRLPEYWEDLFVLKSNEESQYIFLCDKYSYNTAPEDWNKGTLWQISINSRTEFEERYSEYTSDVYSELLPVNCIVIGTKGDTLYSLSLPTDMQYEDSTLGKSLYEVSMSMKDKIIDDFLKINDITKNESAPHIN